MEVVARSTAHPTDDREPQKGCWKTDLNNEGGCCAHLDTVGVGGRSGWFNEWLS